MSLSEVRVDLPAVSGLGVDKSVEPANPAPISNVGVQVGTVLQKGVPAVVENEDSILHKVWRAVPNVLDDVVLFRKGGRAPQPVAGLEVTGSDVFRIATTVRAAVDCGLGVGEAVLNTDIAPFVDTSFTAAGAEELSEFAARDPKGLAAIAKNMQNMHVAADADFEPELKAVTDVDLRGLYPLLGWSYMVMARAAYRYPGMVGLVITQPRGFVESLVATYGPGAGHVLSASHPPSWGVLSQQNLQGPWYGVDVRVLSRRDQGRLDPDRVGILIPENDSASPAYHAVAAWLGIWAALFPDAGSYEMIALGGVGRANPPLTMVDMLHALDILLMTANRYHGVASPAYAKLLLLHGMGGAVRVHSAYKEGGFLRKAIRHAHVGRLHGAVWLGSAESVTFEREFADVLRAPDQVLIWAGLCQLALVLTVQSVLCRERPLVGLFETPGIDSRDTEALYTEAGVEVVRLGPMAAEVSVSHIWDRRIEQAGARVVLTDNLRALLGGADVVRASLSVEESLHYANVRLRPGKVYEHDRHFHEPRRRLPDYPVYFLDRFHDPQLGYLLGLYGNHVPVLRGGYDCSGADVVAAMTGQVDLRCNPAVSGILLADREQVLGAEIMYRQARRGQMGLIYLCDGQVVSVGTRGIRLDGLGWSDHGQLPRVHEFHALALNNVVVSCPYLEDMKRIHVQWSTSGGLTHLHLLDPSRAETAVRL